VTAKPLNQPPLTGAEFQSLEELEVGFSRRLGVLPAHEDTLMNLGYATDSDSGLLLTDAGRRRIQKGG
jgi:hypothetical protein